MRRSRSPFQNDEPLIPGGDIDEASLRWPEVGEDGLLTGVNMATAAFLWSWITQAARLQAADPERAGQLRAALGFDPVKPLFNADAILHTEE